MKRTIITATLLALSTAMAAPASAGGSISLEIEPRNADERRAMRAGLTLYALARHMEGDAVIRQRGDGNAAGIAQRGRGGLGIIEQDGDGHTATLSQNGDGQMYGIFQTGDGTTGHVGQRRDGDTGILIQHGWR
ncbi:hypothetical protein [Sediminimonas sp.]|uniref:hypothetical protein n=1 Tax=Sediminimonas sp. TaxID=2823379 RepID=UPI0025F92B0C|nr:hypothetical protein [Sediminimonas sp.]